MTPSEDRARLVAARERDLLDAARELQLEGGHLAVRMEALGERIGVSKGTVYGHFRSREDVLAGLAMQAMTLRIALFAQATTWPGCTRERMLAVGEAAALFIARHPEHARAEGIAESAGALRSPKTSERRIGALLEGHRTCMSLVDGVVAAALDAGDLRLPASTSPADLAFGLWALCDGAHGLMHSGRPLGALGIDEPGEALFQTYRALLDGHGWRPLSGDHDFRSARDSIRAALDRQVPPAGSG